LSPSFPSPAQGREGREGKKRAPNRGKKISILNLRTSEIHLFYNLQFFYWHFLEILWLFIFLILYLSALPFPGREGRMGKRARKELLLVGKRPSFSQQLFPFIIYNHANTLPGSSLSLLTHNREHPISFLAITFTTQQINS
jgi:hypothetical protein